MKNRLESEFYNSLKSELMSFERYRECANFFKKFSEDNDLDILRTISENELRAHYDLFCIGYLDCCARATDIYEEYLSSIMNLIPKYDKDKIRKNNDKL